MAEGTNLKTYKVPLVWEMWGHVYVDARSKEEAIEIALGPETPLPDGDYIDESVRVDDLVDIEIYEQPEKI